MKYHTRLLRLLTLAAVLLPVAASAVTAPKAPQISGFPKSGQTITVGSSITFSVTANGTNLKYQWQHGDGNITGATKSTYAISKATLSDGGSYAVLVYNTVGNTSCGFTLNVVPPPPVYAGKYNMAVVSYNPMDVYNHAQFDEGSPSGNAHYGTSTASGTKAPFPLAVALKGYLGDNTGASQNLTGAVSTNGTVAINNTDSNLNINMITVNGTTIGFLGWGTPKAGTDNTNDSFILGVSASTTAPKSAAACAGTYTMIVIGYNATAFSKKNAAQNDGDAEIGPATVTSGGTLNAYLSTYAEGGGDSLGNSQIVIGTVSASGTMSSVSVDGNNHPVSIKFVTVGGQVVGFTGSFGPIPGNSNAKDSGLIIGLKSTAVSPLAYTPPIP